MKLGLQSRLLLSLLALFFISFMLLGMVLLDDAENRLAQFRQTQAEFQAKTLAEGSLDALVTEDFEPLELWVRSAMPSDNYAYAALIRPSGQALTHTDHMLVGEYVSAATDVARATSRPAQYKNRPVMEVVHPAVIGDELLANAYVAYYLDTELVLRRETITRLVGVLLLGLILLFAASYLVTRGVTGPIEKLRRAISRTSLDHVVDIEKSLQDRSDEVGELSRAFKNVSEKLIQSHVELTESLLTNKAIVDTSIDGIIVIDRKGVIESVNTAVENIFGYSEEDVIGKNISMLMPQQERSQHDQFLADYGKTRKKKLIGIRREVRGQRKDGSKVPLELSIDEIQKDGQLKFAGTVSDITVRYEYEQALVLAKDAAEQGNKVKTEFLATISHELRTPMNAILGPVELLQCEDLSEESKVYVDMVDRSANRLLELLNNILDFSDLDAGQLVLDKGEFDIREIVRSIISAYKIDNADKPVEFDFEINKAIPNILIGDATRLHNIIGHFMSNAIKFTERGRIVINVSSEGQVNNETLVRFEVCDTGIGIERQDQERIFDVFTQVDGSYTRQYGGAGVGLSLCKNLVEAMGGKIGLESKPKIGSRFWFTVTMASVCDEKIPKQEVTEISSMNEKSNINTIETINDKRVLVVEDDELNQKLIGMMLRRMGYIFDVVGNGKEAVDVMQQHRYDLVLMDCQMPVMSGFEATEYIRSYEAEDIHTPIIAVTANAMQGDREKCLSAGMDDYVPKPINRERLEETIVSWIGVA